MSKIKDGIYVINLDEYINIGTHWVTVYVDNVVPIYFVSFGPEKIPNEIEKFIGNKDFISNIFRIQA